MLPRLEEERGAPINLEFIHVADRVYFADTPYERPVPILSLSDARHFGPYYLALFRQGGELVFSVAISALDTGYETGSPVHDYGALFHFFTTPAGGWNSRSLPRRR